MGHGPDKQPNVGAVPHGIGTTPNITKPCERCCSWGCGVHVPRVDCPACEGTGIVVVMKGGTPRIEDWPGAETVSGQGEKP